MRRQSLLFSFVLVIIISSASEADLTSAQYVTLVLATAPEVRQAEEASVSANAAFKSVLASVVLPSLTFSWTDSLYGNDPTNGSFHGLRVARRDDATSTGAAWNLFNGFQDVLKVRVADRTRERAEIALSASKQARALAAIQAFYNLAANNRLVDVARADLASQEDQFHRTEALYRSGMKGLSDLYKSETEWRSSQVRLISAEAAYKATLEPFNTLVDRAPWAEAAITAELEPGTTDLPRVEEDALRLTERLPELRLALKSLDIARLAQNQSLLGVFPTLSANASWARADAEGAGLWTGRSSTLLGLTLSLPVGFNGVKQGYDHAAARSALRAARGLVDQAQRAARDTLYLAWLALEAATKTYAIAQRQEEIAAQGLEIVAAQYNQGATDALRMAQARADYLNARVQRTTALQSIYLNRAAYRRAAGVPLW